MKNYKQVYIAIDLHNSHSMIGYTDANGNYMGQHQVKTTARNLINQVAAIAAKQKHLTIEQCNMAFAMAEKLRPYVDQLIVCDPRHNRLICQSPNKNDALDTLRLCKLLRLGELKAIWVPKAMGKRRLFYQQFKEYQRLTKLLTAQKNQFQGVLRHLGYDITVSKSDYHHPQQVLEGIQRPGLVEELTAKLDFIQCIITQKAQQLERVKQTGSGYWEIKEFQKMSGVGPVVSHGFSAYIQTPHRFPGSRQLIRFSKLGVASHSSDGRQLKNERLDHTGHGYLKYLSHCVWKAALNSENEVSGFYQASLQRSNNATNARLNTQRKVLTTLWSIWKHKSTYRPERFFAADGNSTQ